MRIAALVKQVPTADGSALEMEAASRRAVAQAVELAAAVGDGEVTLVTVSGPPGDAVLREGIAWASSSSVMADGIRIELPSDAHDPLSIAEAASSAIAGNAQFDLVLLGTASPDNGGLLAPTLAELLDYPFLGPAAFLSMQAEVLHVRCHRENGWLQATVSLPAVISCAMDLIPPCEVRAPALHQLVPSSRLQVVPLGVAPREPRRWDAPVTVGVVVEPSDPESRTALVAAALSLDPPFQGEVVVLECQGSDIAEDVARGVADWCSQRDAAAIVGSTSAWGQEVVGRSVARVAPAPLEPVVINPRSGTDASAPTSESVRTEIIGVRPRGRLRIVSR